MTLLLDFNVVLADVEMEVETMRRMVEDFPEALAGFVRQRMPEVIDETLPGRTGVLYKKGFNGAEADGADVKIFLSDLAKSLERGWERHDMRRYLLHQNPKAFRTPGGELMAFIPIEHMKPTHTSSKRKFHPGTRMSQRVYEAAKMLDATYKRRDGSTRWGERLPAGMQRKTKAHHKTDVRAGMYRFVERGGAKGGSRDVYRSFRTISESNDGWFTPAREPAGVYPKMQDEMRRFAEEYLRDVVGG